jgi:hypothetical protein
MMKYSLHNSNNHGVTIIEMAVVIIIMSVMLLGLFPGVVTIIKYYQNDWILREIRQYGFESLEYIADEMARAEHVKADPFNGYGKIVIRFPNSSQTKVITTTELGGLFQGNQPLLEHRNFPSTGLYRENRHSRQIRVKTFDAFDFERADLDYAMNARAGLAPVYKSMFDIVLQIEVLTPIAGGDDIVEILTFHRQVFVPRMLI